jgi:hypothetical protein
MFAALIALFFIHQKQVSDLFLLVAIAICSLPILLEASRKALPAQPVRRYLAGLPIQPAGAGTAAAPKDRKLLPSNSRILAMDS